MHFATSTKDQAWIDYSTTPMLQCMRPLRAVSVPPSVEFSMSMEMYQPCNFKNRAAMTLPWQTKGTLFSRAAIDGFYTNSVYSFGSMSPKLDISLPQSMNTFSLDYECPKAANLNWQGAPIEIIQAISSTFEELPQYQIVWQFNGNISMVSNKSNLKIKPWVPLPSLLQHPKTVLFITHSGIKSFREGVCFAVPMVRPSRSGTTSRLTKPACSALSVTSFAGGILQ
ncbi:hypothetical protein M513_10985, partial [Trichuris suis]